MFLDETEELKSIYDHAAEPETSYEIGPDSTDAGSSRVSFKAVETLPSELLDSTRVFDGLQSGSTARTGSSDLDLPIKRSRLTFKSPSYGSPSSASPGQLYQQSSAHSYHASSHTGRTKASLQGFITIEDDWDAATAAAFKDVEPTVSLVGQSFAAVSGSLSRLYLHTPVWPLKSREEAYLLRHYVERLSRNFDLADPLCHFRKVVPQRAATCPTLLNAIFALSARHLSRIGDYDPLVSHPYHQECLKYLIPVMDDKSASLDENVLASTIILRHLEEIEVPLSGQEPSDRQSHLFGAHAFIKAQERYSVTGCLRYAAFWVGLRQKMYVGFVNQRPIIPLEYCSIDRSLSAASDDVWTCRMVVLCADVMSWCFGPEGASGFSYAGLVDSVEQWNKRKPPSFTPVYQRKADLESERAFPELWFVSDELLIGLHYYHLAKILLANYNPGIPRLDPGRATALKAMDDEIREHVKVMCGMCMSNTAMSPSFIYASMAVTMAGDKFTDRREQEALMEVLEICDRQHAWPTEAAMENLKVAWGW